VGMSDSTAINERDIGYRLADLYTLCFSHPVVSGIIWHAVVDCEPGACGGGLLRADFAPKYAHKALQKLICDTWHTRAAGVSDAEGRFHFGGFFGNYRVIAGVGAPRPRVAAFALRSDNSLNECTVTIN